MANNKTNNNQNLSDYKKSRTDLNTLLPGVNRTQLVESLNHNIFNRSFTKSEFERIVGIIGKQAVSAEASEFQIEEPTSYRQNNQLQPVVTARVGNIDWFMSFEDFITRISRFGVDTDCYNEWGNALQFNWVPPIDIDKLINYQDYYWDTDDFTDPPQYITIRNNCNWVEARFNESKRTLVGLLENIVVQTVNDATDTISISGNVVTDYTVGDILVFTNSDREVECFQIESVTFNNATLLTDIVLVENIQPDFDYTTFVNSNIPVVSFSEASDTFVVSGDLTNLFSEDYIFTSVLSNTSQPTRVWSTLESSFDDATNQTTVTVNQEIEASFDWQKVNLSAGIRSTQSELQRTCGNPFIFTPVGLWNDSEIGDVLWGNKISVKDLSILGETTLGSNQLVDLTVDFNTEGVEAGHILRIAEGPNEGEYEILSVSTNELTLDANITFFTDASVQYEVYKNQTVDDIKSDISPASPVLFELFWDSTTDQLKQWDGSAFDVVIDNFSLYVSLSNGRHLLDLTSDNSWSNQNKWVHRNQLITFTGKIRAQLPIIEYSSSIELSETSFASKEWSYRSDQTFDYVQTEDEPNLFELIDTTLTGDNEFNFENSTTIVFHEKFGNLTEGLVAGEEIVLTGFLSNDGDYTIVSSEFTQVSPLQRYQTRLVVQQTLVDPFDLPVGANIKPKLTSKGDTNIGPSEYHWQFLGIKEITPSSINPTPNPMLSEYVSSSFDGGSNLERKLGLVWEEYSYTVDGNIGPFIELDTSLHDLCLYEDYQEGDIRVYINGIRQYGNFTEFQSTTNSDYIGSIKFDNNVVLNSTDNVRVELGEYSLDDIGKRAVLVGMPSGLELYNLSDIRKIEQEKTETNQYPYFRLFDVNKNALTFSNSIFKYKESETEEINGNILRRIIYDPIKRDYTFENLLFNDSTGELYVYYDTSLLGDEYQTIWKKGLNNEQYVPAQQDGFWELPNQLYYNVKHQNRKDMKLTEMFRHFSTIINSQKTQGIFNDSMNLFYLDDNVNYGLGGTIKEHNDGFDTLLSSTFVNNVNPVKLMQFAHDQYVFQQQSIKELIRNNPETLFNDVTVDNVTDLSTILAEEVKDRFEKNDRFDQWFGDSTTFVEATNLGVKNWIATAPFFGMAEKTTPYIVNDESMDIIELVHHDGHRARINLEKAELEVIFKQILSLTTSTEQTVTSDADPFPVTIDGNPIQQGNYVLRTNTTGMTRKMYRYNSVAEWEFVNFSLILAESLLNIENSLCDILETSTVESDFDFASILINPKYEELEKVQFSNFVKTNNIDQPLSNINYFKQNDPFTWNYAYTEIQQHPLTGLSFNDVAGSWQGLYEKVYGTPYPHREPWVLQGYENKPTWWDTEYLNTNVLLDRYWTPQMWANICDGIIPVGYLAPDGSNGTGLAGQITDIFSYFSVNIDASPTNDGIGSDELLPPFWNSSNSANPKVRSVHDANNQDFITTPSANFEFGQLGRVEWMWERSSQRLYDDLIISYKIEPMRFLHQNFGYDFTYVSCLNIDQFTKKVPAHNEVVFHGDFIPNTNTVNKVNGLNQWYVHYNRFNGFDGISSEFRSLWRDWDNPLSYLFGAFIDTRNFLIFNESFDITNKDYTTLFKKTDGIRDICIDALKSTVLSVPTKYSPLRDNGIGWTVSMDNTSPSGKPLNFYSPQNYTFSLKDGSTEVFRTYTYELAGADVIDENGYQVIDFNQSLFLSKPTELLNTGFLYYADVLIDGSTTVNLVIAGENAQTIEELLNEINIQLGSNATAYLRQGNIVIQSETTGGGSSVSTTDLGLFVTTDSDFIVVKTSNVSSIEFENIFYVNGNVEFELKAGSTFTITDSTNFDGTYTVKSVTYDIPNIRTIIEVEEDVIMGSNVVDGTIESDSAVTLPDEWKTGQEVYLSSSGQLPNGLNDDLPYYVIRLNDREFSLAENVAAANDGKSITVSGGLGTHKVGRIEYTFNVLGRKQTKTVWRRHFSDTRLVNTCAAPLTISGIQNIVDMIVGYENYHTDLGFTIINPRGENVDLEEGRPRDWQLETEKLINDLYLLRSIRQDDQLEYGITFDSTSNTFTINDQDVNWTNGTRVLLLAESGGQLPAEFDNPLSSSVPYFIVRGTNSRTFQLALTSLDARKGNFISFSDDGIGELKVQVFRDVGKLPVRELNPFKNNMWIEHDTGIVSDIFVGSDMDVITNQMVYDNNQNIMNNDNLIVHRRDIQTNISLILSQQSKNEAEFIKTNNNKQYMSGMHIFFDGYEHILQFTDYSTNNVLIYDGFLGLNTPRFSLEFNRQDDFTLRPNVGGAVILDSDQIQNMEGAIDEMRNYYSTYTSLEGNQTTNLVRDSLGYDGPRDFMDDIRINPKSQFTFWRGMIQNKGTNFAIDAYTNQLLFSTAKVDEFWAYRLACFGDVKEKIYPEMKLFTDDVVRKELRLEFIEPDGGLLDQTFEPVKLTDKERWWNQPDELEQFSPRQAFYFDTKVTSILNNAQNDIEIINGDFILDLNFITDAVVITYFDFDSVSTKQLQEGVDYEFLTSTKLRFTVDSDPRDLAQMSVSTLSYNFDAQNPAKVIDKVAGPVISDVPIWNPVLEQYYHNAFYVVDYKVTNDPARYNVNPDGTSDLSIWDSKYVGQVWFDDSIEGYLPYYDKAIYPDINDRIFLWGTLAEWADIALYQWTESTLTPEEYDAISVQEDGDLSIPNSSRRTGQVYKQIFRNDAVDVVNDPPIWVEEKDIHEEYIAKLVTVTNTTSLTGDVDVYHNGKFVEVIDLDTTNFVTYATSLADSTYIHIVKRAIVPTQEQLDDNLYKIDTPYTRVARYNEDSEQTFFVYYYWVRNTKSPIEINQQGTGITLFEAEKQLKNMPHPYMILQGLKSPDYGYGLIFGNVFDEFEYDLPYRYTQVVVKNLEGTVKDNERYTLRFTRDFTLRDRMPNNDPFISNLSLKNVHWEWKLIREKQLSKIDTKLWDLVIESLIGFKYEDGVLNEDVILPSFNRVLYDQLFDTDTKFGLGPEQIFVQPDLALETILGILNDTNRNFGSIDIDTFLNTNDFTTTQGIITAMTYIYENFEISDINYIFFQVLHDAFSVKREVKEFFKTSWIAAEISQNVTAPNNVDLEPLRLEEGGTCLE